MAPTDEATARSGSVPATGPVALAVVGLGGAVGAATRWALAAAWPTPPGGIGWSTLVENLSGAFLLGLLVSVLAGAAARRGRAATWHHLARLGLGTGVLGGWTTFSTLAVEVDRSVAAGRAGAAAAVVITSVAGGVGLAAAGLALGRRVVPAP